MDMDTIVVTLTIEEYEFIKYLRNFDPDVYVNRKFGQSLIEN